MRIYPVDGKPMTLQEKEWLMDIYNDRRSKIRLQLVIGFFGFLVISYPWIWFGAAINICLALAVAVFYSVFNYCWFTRPYKKDVEGGVKYKLPFKVTEKRFYPMIGQYMVSVFGIGRMVEVDQDTFQNCKEGEDIFLYMALRCRYLFNNLDSFEVE